MPSPALLLTGFPGLLLVAALGPSASPWSPAPGEPAEPPSSVAAPAAAPGQPRAQGVWPLRPDPEVVATFEAPASPYAAGHRGVDLLGRAGRPVRAALDGRVSFAGLIAGRGVVVVAHGATRTTYEPVAAGLDVGEPVTAGDVVGRLEVAPSHCAPRVCLHWGWIESGAAGDRYLDPLRLVGAGPVRLLPLWATTPLTPLGPAALLAPSVAPPSYDTPYRAVLTGLAALL